MTSRTIAGRGRAHQRGLTLIEIMITLAIVGVMAGAVLLSLGGRDAGSAGEAEAQRLASRLQIAADDVLVTRQPIALSADEDGYRFLRQGGAGLAPIEEGALAGEHALPRGLHLLADGERFSASGGTTIMIRADGLGDTAELVIAQRRGQGRWPVTFDGLRARAAAADREGR